MKHKFILSILVILAGFYVISSRYFDFDWNEFHESLREKISFTNDGNESSNIQIGQETIRLIDEESVVIDVIEKVSPSVVTVGVIQEKPLFEYDTFDPFGFFDRPRELGSEKEEMDIGSGFIISKDGLIVTNKHVVQNNDYEYKVITSDNEIYDVLNIYRDPINDLAILKINASNLTPVVLGNSDNLKVGQTVIALGTPLGEFRGTATKGIVSGLGRGITTGSLYQQSAEELDDVIQTDAAINPGNSGGPLIDTSSQVIGINTAIVSNAENIGFALPINIVKEAVNVFEDTGSFDRAFLGVSYRMIDRDLSVMNDIPEGAYVVEVLENSAAQKAGIEKGDIIIRFDGERVKSDDDQNLAEKISRKRKGDSIGLIVWRDGKEVNLTASLGEFDGL